jgi:hypothetical protein
MPQRRFSNGTFGAEPSVSWSGPKDGFVRKADIEQNSLNASIEPKEQRLEGQRA